MVELTVRMVLATAALLASGATGTPPFDLTAQGVALFATYSFLLWGLERRGMRNSGVSGLAGAADAAVVAFLMAGAGQIDRLGFLSLTPLVWAVTRHGANALSMAPIVSAWLLVGANLFDGRGWTPTLLAQAAGVLGIGLLVHRTRQVVTVREVVEVPVDRPGEPIVPADYTELRENYRTLRAHARDLERRGKRDRTTVQLLDATENGGENPFLAMARRLREVLNVEGVNLYSFSNQVDAMVVRASAGEVPGALRDTAFPLTTPIADWQARDRLEAAFRAVPYPAAHTSAVVLKDSGRIIGALGLYDSTKGRIHEAADVAAEVADTVGWLLRKLHEREDERRRLRESGLLYEVASVTQGSDTPLTLATRLVREMWDMLRLDHVALHVVDGGSTMTLASEGAAMNVLELLAFPGAAGLPGWLEIGAPEVVLLDARDDERLSHEAALKRRVGSFVVVPLTFGDRPNGFLTAGTHRVNGIGAAELEALRVVAAEAGQALGRLQVGTGQAFGLAAPVEFHRRVTAAGTGHLVYLEVPRRDELEQAHGKTSVDFAVRQLALRLRATLPTGGLLCRRPEGDYIAFLETDDEGAAGQWANSAVATAALVPVSTPDGRVRLPLALKAKVARLSPQSRQTSAGSAA